MTGVPIHDPTVQCHEDWMQTTWRPWAEVQISDLVSEVNSLKEKVAQMADELDTTKTDFETYQMLVNSTLAGLQTTITNLTAGQLDPAKAAALDAEIQTAIKALSPPTPAPAGS